MFRRFHKKPRNFSVLWKHATFTLLFVVRLAGFKFKGCEGPNRNRAWVIHQIERISQRKPIITKGMRHWPWVCDVDMQISNDCLYFTFNVKHPTSIVQDVPRTEHTTAYMYMSISNEANNNQLINLNVSVLFCRSLRFINIIMTERITKKPKKVAIFLFSIWVFSIWFSKSAFYRRAAGFESGLCKEPGPGLVKRDIYWAIYGVWALDDSRSTRPT